MPGTPANAWFTRSLYNFAAAGLVYTKWLPFIFICPASR